MKSFRTYMVVGGMPQAVDAYVSGKSYEQIDFVKRNILSLYEEDLAKYDTENREKASVIYRTIPEQQIGYWFENGVQLSGGQWQRLAICRTMARDNEILLLDEPNAALDAITFRMLYNEINAQANRKVCVMLLQHFVNFIGGNEEICVFDDGKLISRGKHDRLYDTCRIYKELYDAQQ